MSLEQHVGRDVMDTRAPNAAHVSLFRAAKPLTIASNSDEKARGITVKDSCADVCSIPASDQAVLRRDDRWLATLVGNAR
jgi:hypothetical protein